MIDVKVIRRDGGVVLVEWHDGEEGYRRTILPARSIKKGDKCTREELGRGIPYGLRWSELVSLSATSEQLEQQLYRAGIWTAEDLRANPEVARGAIMAVYGIDFAALLRAISREASL